MIERKFITAYDPKINRRVPHIVIKGKAVSLVTKNSFKYTKSNKKSK